MRTCLAIAGWLSSRSFANWRWLILAFIHQRLLIFGCWHGSEFIKIWTHEPMGAHRDHYFSRLDHCFERYSNAVPRCSTVFFNRRCSPNCHWLGNVLDSKGQVITPFCSLTPIFFRSAVLPATLNT